MRLVLQAAGGYRGSVFVPAASGKVLVTVQDDSGATTDRLEVAPNKLPSREAACRRLKLDDPTLLRLCDEASKGAAITHEVRGQADVTGGLVVTVRDIEAATGDDTRTTPAAVLRDLLPTVANDRLVCWTDQKQLACLDVDYHTESPPPRTHLETWVEARVQPKPAAWHFSRGGGLHLFYVAAGGLDANELAAVAALRFRTIDSTAGVELKAQVRGPGAERVHVATAQDTQGLTAWLGGGIEADEQAVQEWLDANNLERGQRYDHDRCPIDPSDTATNQPVVVGDHGIKCHRCAGKGFTFGSRTPGFVPYAALTGGASSGEVGAMVRGLVHYGHARWVLEHKLGLPESLARLAYAAALKSYHADTGRAELVSAAFDPNVECLTRSNDSWVNLNSSLVYPTTQIGPLLGALPAAQVVTEKGPKTNPVSVAYLSQGHNLDDRGYRNVIAVQGARLSAQYLPPPPETLVPVLDPKFRGHPNAPRYVPRSRRMSVAEAEAVYETYFPKVSFQVLRVLVCAMGCAQETRLGLHPFVFLAGNTGVAKSTTCNLAAGITGTKALEVLYRADEDRMKQAIKSAGEGAGLVVANEFIKESKRALKRYDPRAALETLLTLTPDTMCHVLYTGARRLGRVPAVVITETDCPYALKDYTQVARRVRMVRLFHRKDRLGWTQNQAKLGLTPGTTHLYRLASKDLAAAADVLYSDLIDKYFSTPESPWTWDDIADDLGAPTIEKSTEFDDPLPMLRRFFRQVCDAPEITDPRLKRQYAAGYKRIHRSDHADAAATELCDSYTTFADGGDWCRAGALDEKNWGDILGVDDPVQMDMRTDGVSAVYVRFRVGPNTKPTKVNGQIITLPPEDDA